MIGNTERQVSCNHKIYTEVPPSVIKVEVIQNGL